MVSKALREERQQPRRWFYLSFADNYGFLGATRRTIDLGVQRPIPNQPLLLLRLALACQSLGQEHLE